MDWSILSQLTVGTAAVGVLGYSIKLFMKRLKERDEFLEKLLDNHFGTHTKAMNRLANKIDIIINRRRGR